MFHDTPKEFSKYLDNNRNKQQLPFKLMLSLYFLTDCQTKIETTGNFVEQPGNVHPKVQLAMYKTPKTIILLDRPLHRNLGFLSRAGPMENQ